jgi:hypothetical protein
VNQNSWDGNEHVAAPVWPEQQAGQVADSPSLASASTSGARSRPASPELRARRSNSKEQNDGEKQLALWTEYLVEKHLARQRQERFVKNKILLSTQRLSTSVLDDQQHIDILIRIDAVASAFSNPQQVCSSLRQAYSNSQREIELLTLQLKRIENLESALNCLLADDDKLSEDGVVEVAAQREVEQFTQAAAEAQSSKADVDSMQKAELLDSAAMKL